MCIVQDFLAGQAVLDIVIRDAGKDVQIAVKNAVPVSINGCGKIDLLPVSYYTLFWITRIGVFGTVTPAIIIYDRRGDITGLAHVDGIVRDLLIFFAHKMRNTGYPSFVPDHAVAVRIVYYPVAIGIKISAELAIPIDVLTIVQLAVTVYVPFQVLGVIACHPLERLGGLVVFIKEIVARDRAARLFIIGDPPGDLVVLLGPLEQRFFYQDLLAAPDVVF